jgi:protein-S-isoprenylcysteine O-methyltransferase Ste14
MIELSQRRLRISIGFGEKNMNFVHLNLICWGIFILAWIGGAIYNHYHAPAVQQRRLRFDWMILLLFWGVIQYIAVRYPGALAFHLLWLQVVGAVLLAGSTLFTLWARWKLGKMWASVAVVKEAHRLCTEGPYRITRHPIYTGIIGMVLGSALSTGAGVLFLGFLGILILFLIRIRIEERLMVQTFGEQYLEYKKRVPRLIPGLKWRK